MAPRDKSNGYSSRNTSSGKHMAQISFDAKAGVDDATIRKTARREKRKGIFIGLIIALVVAGFGVYKFAPNSLLNNVFSIFDSSETYSYDAVSFSSPVKLVDSPQLAAVVSRTGTGGAAFISEDMEQKNLTVSIQKIPFPKDLEKISYFLGTPDEYKLKEMLAQSAPVADFVEIDGNLLYLGGYEHVQKGKDRKYMILDAEKLQCFIIHILTNSEQGEAYDAVQKVYESVMYNGKKLYR